MIAQTENDNIMRNDPLFIPPLQQQQQQQQQNRHHHHHNHYGVRMYVLISFIGALIAIMTTTNGINNPVMSSPDPTVVKKEDLFSVENVAKAAILGTQQQQQLLESDDEDDDKEQQKNKKKKYSRKSPLLRLMAIWKEQQKSKANMENNHHDENHENHEKDSSNQKPNRRSLFSLLKSNYWTLDNPFSADSATAVIDKVLSSTPRIIAIANLLLAVTYLLHSLVADYFLGPTTTIANHHRAANNNNNIDGTNLRMDAPLLNTNDRREGGNNDNTTNGSHFHRSGRERLGGYLMFKLLLISAVVEPDSLDLLILSSWYTLLSFLRSLSHLCGATISHTAQSGQPPRVGVCYLLTLLLIMNFLSAAVCAALFHGAGWNMVLLLTCDCALLANDIVVHLIRYIQQSLDEKHSISLAIMEEQQLLYHAQIRSTSSPRHQQDQQDQVEGEEGEEEAIRTNSRLLDRQMELQEAAHSRRLGVLDNVAFGLELLSLNLTFAHFVHIWSLHGITFGLVDGVLVLHLHSALSHMGKKILERRNLHRIARDLNAIFQDASEHEMKKAGDICCICLGSLSIGHVKKVGCGHLYHTNCLREVVERAQSIEAAKCPLCRARVIDASRQQQNATNANTPVPNNNNNNIDNNGPLQDDTTNNNAIPNPAVPPVNAGNGVGGEHALFRFSTEGILPSWIPIPAFSFEVVRRPPTNSTLTATNDNNNNNNNRAENPNANNGDAPNNEDLAVVNNNTNNGQQGGEMSFWRRLFILTGIIPMTPQEEISALNQLVDMFPQYDRADLLRELRERRSPEAVVESVLMGVFSGQPRTDGFDAVPVPANQNNDQAQNSPLPNNNLETTDTTDLNRNNSNGTDVDETTVTENATRDGNEISPNPR